MIFSIKQKHALDSEYRETSPSSLNLKLRATMVYYLIFIILNVNSTIISAQNKEFKPEIWLGVHGGMNASMVFFKPAVPQSYFMGRNGGITFQFNSEKSLGIQAELNYVERGWTESNGLLDTYARRLQYIELPFMTHIYFGNKFRFYFDLGPEMAYLIGEQEVSNYFVNSVAEQHIQAVQNKFDYGFAVGTGFSLQLGRQVVQIGINGSYSLGDIFSNAKKDYFDTSNSVVAGVRACWMIQTNK